MTKLWVIKDLKNEDIKLIEKEFGSVVRKNGDTFWIYLRENKIQRFENIFSKKILKIDTFRYSDDGYHSYNDFLIDFDSLAQLHPEIAKLETLGFSVEGRIILAMKISDNVEIDEPEPEVRIVGLHHGNEWISAEIPILLAHYLLDNYGSDPEVTYLVNNREIWIIPMFNPDGRVHDTRYNANGIDLNRDYG